MLRRTLRGGVLFALLAIALSACELTVRIGTVVHDDGSGIFSLAIQLDEELVEGLEQAAESSEDAGSSIATLEALFDRLEDRGWETSRTVPNGGLLLEAERPFTGQDDFDRALAELAGAGDQDEQPVDLASLRLDFQTERSFLRTTSRFSGGIDLGFGDQIDPIIEQLSDVLDDAVSFEISAVLPGAVSVREGGGTVEGDVVVWRPRFGEATTMLAEASQLRVGPLLLIIIPALLIAAFVGWMLMGRRSDPAPAEVEAITREQPAILAEVHPNGARSPADQAPAASAGDGDDGSEQGPVR